MGSFGMRFGPGRARCSLECAGAPTTFLSGQMVRLLCTERLQRGERAFPRPCARAKSPDLELPSGDFWLKSADFGLASGDFEPGSTDTALASGGFLSLSG